MLLRISIVALSVMAAIPLALRPAKAQIATFAGSSINHLDPQANQSTGGRILEAVLANDNMQATAEFAANDIIRRLAKPVGRLTLQLKGDQPAPKGAYCTASLIGPDLILTNYHCVPGNGDVSAALLTMGYLKPRTRTGVAQYPVDLTPVEASKDLDYAILRVDGRPGDEWGTIALSTETPEALTSLFIIHHPGGYPQYVTQGRCQTSDPALDGSDILHVCDTLPGSSGAPIFDNATRKVVGLHYSAVALKKLNAGKQIASIAKASPLIGRLIQRPDAPGAGPREAAEMAAMKAQLAALEEKLKATQQPRPKTDVAIAPGPPVGPAVQQPGPPALAPVKPGEMLRDCATCPEMVVVPGGSFTMGSPDNEPNRGKEEGPQRKVTIAKPFAVGKFEVTFAEWDACVADKGCTHQPVDQGWGRGKRPVINVSWNDAKEYVAWLSRKTGQSYRLLTEAEWEYAARAGTTTPFSTGATISAAQANFNGNYTYNGSAKGQYRERTIDVGSFKPNDFGLYDMHGNVWEWVEDCYADSYAGAPADGSARTTGQCVSRVLRGGSWFSYPQILRAASRVGYLPGYRDSLNGFRLARTLIHTP